ncbi:MAG: DEAD/DEAH box helicase [Kiloniellales bacterium]
MTDKTFASLGLAEPLCRALSAENYQEPTPIQAQAIPSLLDGRDLLGVAQTGTGKTAAFALPILQRLFNQREDRIPRAPRALILAPTRELAIQIGEALTVYGRHLGLRHTVIYGGVGQQPQVRALTRGLDIVVATPGRLLDLVSQRHLRLDQVTFLVLDEADRMLDMGFIRDVRKIVAAVPKQRQTLLFSATMPADVAQLASAILREPVRVEVTPKVVTVERIDQRVYFVDKADKRDLLVTLLRDPSLARVIVFTRTKHGADRVTRHLDKAGIAADAIHGDKGQSARQRALESFRAGKARVLVATDIAARGIDVDDVSHVVNFEIPNVPESYVHRIGRTARAGAAGIALSFCDAEERAYLRDIEKLTKRPLLVAGGEPGRHKAAPSKPRHVLSKEGQSRQGKPSQGKPGQAPRLATEDGKQPSRPRRQRRRFRGQQRRRAA